MRGGLRRARSRADSARGNRTIQPGDRGGAGRGRRAPSPRGQRIRISGKIIFDRASFRRNAVRWRDWSVFAVFSHAEPASTSAENAPEAGSGVFERQVTGADRLGSPKLIAISSPDDHAAVEDSEAVGHGGADRDTLLDQQDG